jgi:hypothetical protein
MELIEMITIYTLEEINELINITKELKEELLNYFHEITEGIVGEEWEGYNLSEVGPILLVEDGDTINVLDEYGLLQGNENIPQTLPEFALRVKIGEVELLKIIWVCNDSFGLSVYYPVGGFGKEFEEWVVDYLVDQ